MREDRKPAFHRNSRDFGIMFLILFLMLLIVSLLTYPNSLGLIEIAICVSAIVIEAIFTFALLLLVGWFAEQFPKFENLGVCIAVALGVGFPVAFPFWVGPSLLYPLLGKIFRGSIEFEFWPLLVALGLILGIISSIITIHGFLVKWRKKKRRA